ncbi:hypothetical protein POTOM_011149 [Populus tomentosa]|uniref:DUF4283 domain-containing protein n=1 Tax=Populus tomentosa TaxID=118781 RepID=A0A8X8AJ54_POPTO|nr:hypothetical protein POTOM_011149 [Populus tomentosa]
MKSWFSQTELLHFFNDLLFDSFKLRANPVRFHRQPPSPIALPRRPQAPQGHPFQSDSGTIEATHAEVGDIAWLKTGLFGRISNGVNYKSIKRGLVDSGMQLDGFCFIGGMHSSLALISFDSAEDMMAALQVDTQAWKNNFDELRPRTQTDGPNDRLARVTFSNLPIMALNVTCIKKILHILGRVFGFDRISLLFNTLDHTLKSLMATMEDEEDDDSETTQAQAAFVTECRSEVDTFDASFDQHRG